MPGKIRRMENSNHASPEGGTNNATNRRKSGREKKERVLYQQDPNVSIVSNGSGKRKRADARQIQEASDDAAEETEEDSEASSDEEPDEEELKGTRRKTSTNAKKGPGKQSSKRVRTGKDTPSKLPIRTAATNGIKKHIKPTKARANTAVTAESNSSDLYCKHLNMAVSIALTDTIHSNDLLRKHTAGRSC